MRPWSSFLKDDRGAIAAITIIMLAAFFALLAIVIDLGHLMLVRNQLQNAADAGALAGARALFYNNSTGTPAWAAGQAAAIATVKDNKADTYGLSTATVQTGYWNTTWSPATAPANLLSTGIVPGLIDAPAVKVDVRKIAGSNNGPVALTFGQIFGITTVNVSAQATAILSQVSSGPFGDTIFSNNTLRINGTEKITGSVYTNHNLKVNGTETITGAAVGVGGVSINGTESIGSVQTGPGNSITLSPTVTAGSESYNATTMNMPDYTSQILATPNLQTFTSSQTFNGTQPLSGNIYVEGDVTINGTMNYTGTILATGTITINGTQTFLTGSNQMFLYSTSNSPQAIVLNGTQSFASGDASVVVYAPNGTITTNGTQTLNGIIVGNTVNINGTQNINGGFPIQFLQQFAPPELVQ